MDRLALILAFSVASLCGPLQAQSIAPGDSARWDTIERLLVISDAERTYTQTLDSTIAEQLRTSPTMAAYADVLRAFIAKYASYPVIKPVLMQLYRETFTEAEMQQLIEFYRSDFGRRFMIRMTQIAAKAARLSSMQIQQHLPELIADIQARIQHQP